MEPAFSTLGTLVGLAVAIVLIMRKAQPAYSLIFGAFLGGILGGGALTETVDAMVSGAQNMASPILRVLTSGVLVGALIKSGAAQKIAETIVSTLGAKRAIPAIAVATLVICAVGVFIDIAVITAAPVALMVGRQARINKESILLAMIGGSQAGNIISPNPNTLAVAEAFDVELTSLMMKNIIPSIVALTVTIILSTFLSKRKNGIPILVIDVENSHAKLPSIFTAALGPFTVVLLLALRPLFGITVDPLVALPAGGLVCLIATRQLKNIFSYLEFGISKVAEVSVLLLGTGAIAGVIRASEVQGDVVALLAALQMPTFMLASLSGFLLTGATGSTTAGATIASQTFHTILEEANVDSLSAGAMINSGAAAFDSLPHGSYFHATAAAVFLAFKDRFKLFPFELTVGLSSVGSATLLYYLTR